MNFLNETIRSGTFLSILKNRDITALFKKGFKGSKENYRSVSVLPIISKISEKIISKQITKFTDPLLSKYQYGFRRGFSAQTFSIGNVRKMEIIGG